VANGEDPVFRAAVDVVVVDRRRGNPQLAVEEALLETYDLLSEDQLVPYGDGTDDAYRVVLRRLHRAPTRDELGELIRLLAADEFVELTDLQEFWVLRVRRGDPI
jgi:hypothetical protein